MATIYDPESSDSDDEGSTLSLRIVKRPQGVSNNRRVILDGIISDDDENMSKSSERRSILEGVSKESDEDDCFEEDSGVLVDEDRSSCSCEDEFTALAANINNNDVNDQILCQIPGTNCNEEIKKGIVLDTHCHLEFIRRRFGRDVSLSDCLELDGENLGDKFLGAIVNFCQPSEWYRGPGAVSPLLRDSARDRRVGVTVGCHPHFADQMTEAKWAQLEALVRSPSPQFPWLRVVAVGECGLDYSHKNTVPRSLQRLVFARQLRLAIRFNIPLVLHIRDAEADGLEVCGEVGVPLDYPLHRHCFGGDVDYARTWLAKYKECKLGFTGLVTNHYAFRATQVIQEVGLDKILLETDAPYFLPTKAARNGWNCSFPGHVIHVAKAVSEIKKCSLTTVLEQNLANSKLIYRRFFDQVKEIRSVRVKRIDRGMKNVDVDSETENQHEVLNMLTSIRPKLIKIIRN